MCILIHLLVCAAIISTVESYNNDNMKDSILQKLGLTELPKIQKSDLENLVVPTQIKNKYLSLLKIHNKRRRRSLPSLAGILRNTQQYSGIPRRIQGNTDMTGQVMYTDITRQRFVFDMESRLQANTEVTMAELKLYQTAPRKIPVLEKKKHRPVNNARVTIYWVDVLENGSNKTALVDSRLVPVHEGGWRNFDVTQAVHYWSKSQRKTPLHLEVWIEGERPGSYAAQMAKRVYFITQNPLVNTLDSSPGTPELVLYTLDLDEYGSPSDCRRSKENICCREEHYINFRELTWTQYWILEPVGYQAFRCTGGCKQPKRSYGYGQRSCAVLESAPLPVMYLVKRGDHTEIEVAEFPDMIVEKCGCFTDKMSTT